MGRPRQDSLILTDRQRQVLDLIVKGHSNGEIAELLGVSLAGAKWHVSDLLAKFGVDSRDELAERWEAMRRGRFSRLARAVGLTFAISPLKAGLAGGVAAAAIGAGFVGYALLGTGAPAPSQVASRYAPAGKDHYWEDEDLVVRELWRFLWRVEDVRSSSGTEDVEVEVLIEDGKPGRLGYRITLDREVAEPLLWPRRPGRGNFGSHSKDENVRLMREPSGPQIHAAWLNGDEGTVALVIYPNQLGGWCQEQVAHQGGTGASVACGTSGPTGFEPISMASGAIFGPEGAHVLGIEATVQPCIATIEVVQGDGTRMAVATSAAEGSGLNVRFALLSVEVLDLNVVVIGYDKDGHELARSTPSAGGGATGECASRGGGKRRLASSRGTGALADARATGLRAGGPSGGGAAVDVAAGILQGRSYFALKSSQRTKSPAFISARVRRESAYSSSVIVSGSTCMRTMSRMSSASVSLRSSMMRWSSSFAVDIESVYRWIAASGGERRRGRALADARATDCGLLTAGR